MQQELSHCCENIFILFAYVSPWGVTILEDEGVSLNPSMNSYDWIVKRVYTWFNRIMNDS